LQFLETTFYSNTIKEWAISIVVFFICFIFLRIFKSLLIRKVKKFSKKTETKLDDFIVLLLKKTKLFFIFFASYYIGSILLELPETVKTINNKIIILVFLLQGAIWGLEAISYWVNKYKIEKIEKDAESATTIAGLGFVAKVILWTIILLLALDNFGVNITTVVAGLGVGGVAIALAVQSILGDIFASLSIVLDKPFVIGDYIVVDNFRGTVEHIGLKTTRLRSLSGEQLVFSNNDLLKSRIQNYKRMNERRASFSIGVTYQTSYKNLKKIPDIIKTIIEKNENARFDRSHFYSYGDFSLNFQTVYWVTIPDYSIFMDTQQEINLAIFKKFEEEGIEFAYPTQTIFVEKE